jgi:hypothetical protein
VVALEEACELRLPPALFMPRKPHPINYTAVVYLMLEGMMQRRYQQLPADCNAIQRAPGKTSCVPVLHLMLC